MSSDATEIDRIVAEVLRRLEAQGRGAAAASGSNGELTVEDRVVTMAVLNGRLDNVRRVAVRGDAIVTPAVHDELRDRGIELTRGVASSGASGNKSSAGVVRLLIAATPPCDAVPLVSAIRGEADVTTVPCNNVIESIEQLAASLAPGNCLAVLLTSDAEAALCLANRHRGVRAVSAQSASTVTQSAAAIGANLLIADPADRNVHEMAKMVRAFVRGGCRTCPGSLRTALGD